MAPQIIPTMGPPRHSPAIRPVRPPIVIMTRGGVGEGLGEGVGVFPPYVSVNVNVRMLKSFRF